MRILAFALACLTCDGRAYRLPISERVLQRRLPADSSSLAFDDATQPDLRSLAKILLAYRPAVALVGNHVGVAGTNRVSSVVSALRHPPAKMMAAIPNGANVVVVGEGPIQYLAARLAAIRGFSTSLIPRSPIVQVEASRLCFDEENYPLGSIPLETEIESIKDVLEKADGLILAYDDQDQLLTPGTFNKILPKDSKVKHISLMSRYLNGAGMGFFPDTAKAANNPEIWNAKADTVSAYKEIERMVKERAKEIGASFTIIRAGTLKGGGNGGASCEKTFLNKEFYKLGLQDIGNWRVLYDVFGLGVEISKGDTLPGPGFTAAMTARESVGDGDSHRGAVASALVEALRTPAAKDTDFSVKAVKVEKEHKFVTPEEMAALLEKA